VARKKRRRPKAGPPVVRSPRHEANQAQVEQPARGGSSGKGMPQPMSLRGVALRALVAALIFFVYVMVVGGAGPEAALPFAALAFVLIVPLGLLMDRAVYRLRMRRWQRDRGAG
jgi:hypothetical protein